MAIKKIVQERFQTSRGMTCDTLALASFWEYLTIAQNIIENHSELWGTMSVSNFMHKLLSDKQLAMTFRDILDARIRDGFDS